MSDPKDVPTEELTTLEVLAYKMACEDYPGYKIEQNPALFTDYLEAAERRLHPRPKIEGKSGVKLSEEQLQRYRRIEDAAKGVTIVVGEPIGRPLDPEAASDLEKTNDPAEAVEVVEAPRVDGDGLRGAREVRRRGSE